MQPATPLIVACLLIALAGCLGPPDDGDDDPTPTATPSPTPIDHGPPERPEDWQSGIELLLHTSTSLHSGQYSARLFPPNSTDPPIPAACTTYRGDQEVEGDECDVIENASGSVEEAGWGIRAFWRAQPHEGFYGPRPTDPTVVAFDDAGIVVAFWDGDEHPRARHVTE